jgi:hypothetical protein
MIWLSASPGFGLSGTVGMAQTRKFRTTTVARAKAKAAETRAAQKKAKPEHVNRDAARVVREAPEQGTVK